ncbi:MAG: MFS transporter [Bacillota bacterium]|nr:MAG: MFS transporter [Bacillota bacterium]
MTTPTHPAKPALATEPTGERARKPSGVDANLLIVFGVTLFAVLGVSTIAPVLPSVVAEFNLSETQSGLLITAFTLPGVILTPFVGVFGDRLGRKKILVPALLLFGLAGGSCGLTKDFGLLILLRILQGAGASALSTLNTTIIGDLYQGPERARAMGLNASVLSLAVASYPIIGGSLAVFGWNYPFLLPWLAVPMAVAVARFLTAPEPLNGQALTDYLGDAWHEIKKPRMLAVFASSVLIFVVLYGGYLTYLSLYLGRVLGSSPVVIGLLMFVTSVSTALVSSQLGALGRRFGTNTLLAVGFAGYAVGLVVVPLARSVWALAVPLLVFGAAHGLNLPSLQTMLAEEAPLEHRGLMMSLNGMMLRTGQTLGPLVMGLAFGAWGYRGAFWTATLVALAGLALVLVVFTPGRAPAGDNRQA